MKKENGKFYGYIHNDIKLKRNNPTIFLNMYKFIRNLLPLQIAIYVARKYGEIEKYFSGQHMWARGYFVSTVGMNEEVIRKYIRNQEKTLVLIFLHNRNVEQ